MECVSLLGKCRACRIKTQKEFQHHIFTTENLQQIFHEATSLEIHENDGLPGILCDDCHSRLIDAFEFRQMCESSARAFREIPLDGDSDYEEKYRPPEEPNEVDGVPVEETTPELDSNVTEEKYIPVESLVRTELIVEESDILNPPKRKRGRPRKDKSDPIASKAGKQPNNSSKLGKPRVKKENEQENPEEITSDLKHDPDVPVWGKMKGMQRECALCGKKYVHKANLKWHMRIVHQGLKAAKCNLCGKEFTRPYTLNTHMMVMHGDKEVMRCPECKMIFRVKEKLEKHMRDWHDPEKPREKIKSICELCGKAFPSNSSLARHMSSHFGIKPFQCTICAKAYNRKHRLKDHMMRHEGIKNHVCTICGLRKTTLTELKVHMNIHTRERTFTCEYCAKVFLKAAGLSRHVKVVHQGLKAFPCPHCERSFGKKETLKHHIMTHTGERPHGCELCGKRFIQPTALQTHMKTHQKYSLL